MTPKSEVRLITAHLTGGGAAASMVNADSSHFGGGEIVSATYVSTGVFTIAFRNKYPQLLGGTPPLTVGSTAGLSGTFTALDVSAGTGTLKLSVGGVATDPATTDEVYFTLFVRNSGRNS